MNRDSFGILYSHLNALDSSQFNINKISTCIAGHTLKSKGEKFKTSSVEDVTNTFNRASTILGLTQLESFDLFEAPVIFEANYQECLEMISTIFTKLCEDPYQQIKIEWN